MAVNDPKFVDYREVRGMAGLILGRKSCDKVRPNCYFRTAVFKLTDQADGILAQMAALHALEDQVIAMLQGQVNMGHDPWFARQQLKEAVIDLNPVEG